jgi:hypothetical protein
MVQDNQSGEGKYIDFGGSLRKLGVFVGAVEEEEEENEQETKPVQAA